MTDLRARLSISAAVAKRVFGGQPPQAVTAAGAVFLGQKDGGPECVEELEAGMREALIAAKATFGQPVDPQAVAMLLAELLGEKPGADAREVLRETISAPLEALLGEVEELRKEIAEVRRAVSERPEEPRPSKKGAPARA